MNISSGGMWRVATAAVMGLSAGFAVSLLWKVGEVLHRNWDTPLSPPAKKRTCLIFAIASAVTAGAAALSMNAIESGVNSKIQHVNDYFKGFIE